MLKFSRPFLILFLFFAFCFSTFARKPAAVKTPPIKILFIANSFVYNNHLPEIERGLAQVAGINVVIDDEIELGQSMNSHITDPQCWAKIKSRKWDYVVIQDNQRFYYNTPPSLDSFGMATGNFFLRPFLPNIFNLQTSIRKLIPV